jgi:hypothetical protein
MLNEIIENQEMLSLEYERIMSPEDAARYLCVENIEEYLNYRKRREEVVQ